MGPEETAGAPRRSLPPISEYLRATFALGRRSLQVALPALLVLYCYRLLVNLFLEFSSGTGHSGAYMHGYDQDAILASIRIHAAFYLPLLVLIYTPFLPLQDGILRGTPRSFASCARLVLERIVPFALSAIAQAVLVLGPPMFLGGVVVLIVQSLPAKPDSLVQALTFATLMPCLLYAAIVALFLMFATPAVVLEHRGPLASIRVSFGLVVHHFGGILGRLFVFFFLLIVVGIFLSVPEGILVGVSTLAGYNNPAFSIAKAIWSAAVSVLLFPFSVAALMVLYRAVSPAPSAAEAPGSTDPELAGRPTTSSPYVFE